MGTVKHADFEFTISYTGSPISTEHRQSIIQVLDNIADLSNDELGSILDLEVATSISLDDNVTVIRTK